MSVWESVTWDIARAGGFTAYLLLTLSVAIGLALTMHWQSGNWPRIINSELHNFITLLSLVFTGIHVLAVWIDPFTRFGWSEVFIPLASHYRPLWMAFGIVALYLGLAIGISTWIRPLIGYSWWRRLHVLTLLSYILVTIHGLATGSDTRTWWGAGIYTASIILVGVLLWIRLIEPANKQSRAHPVFAVGILLAVLALTLWTVLGPLQPGWNAYANNGNGSGGASTISSQAQAAQAAPTTPAQQARQGTLFAPPFTAPVQGTLTQKEPDTNGNVTLHLDMTTSQGTPAQVHVTLQGQSVSGGGNDDRGGISITASQVTLADSTGKALYSGLSEPAFRRKALVHDGRTYGNVRGRWKSAAGERRCADQRWWSNYWHGCRSDI